MPKLRFCDHSNPKLKIHGKDSPIGIMTTTETQMKRLAKTLARGDDDGSWKRIPPVVLMNTKGILFMKKIALGNQNSLAPGVFLSRKENGDWGLPITVHLVSGILDLKGGAACHAGKRADILVLITSADVIHAIEKMGQVGFDGITHKLAEGPIMEAEAKDGYLLSFVEAVSKDPNFIVQQSFLYVISDHHFQSGFGHELLFQARETSNQKFYNNKAATAIEISAGVIPCPIWRMNQVLEVRKSLLLAFGSRGPESAILPPSRGRETSSASKTEYETWRDRQASFDFSV